MATHLPVSLILAVAIGLLPLTHPVQAQDSPAATAASTNQSLAEISQQSADFVRAFNKGDAVAVSAFWAPDGEYTDEAGQRFVGRKAIQAEYTTFFAAHPGRTIQIAIDSLRLISDTLAIEDGHSKLVPPPPGPPAGSRYTAVHLKVDGRWLLASVREARVASPSTYSHLKDFEWMIGSWASNEQSTWNVGNTVTIDIQWGPNKSSVELTYRINGSGGDETATGRQIIAWDPETRRIHSWAFAADGGRSIGIWTERNDSWTVESSGILPDGTKTSSVNAFTRVGDAEPAMIWQSSRQTSGKTALPDTDEVVLQRVTGVD
ncbi:MAG TPA: SgcJ/EcaC family oxidoreductase [Pirellulales bacterium]|jgi:uncharacterized protein (TIGR02246 family)|nr:SgcJ/EcaC family oxidoreductase [Pirellulales bacterium]